MYGSHKKDLSESSRTRLRLKSVSRPVEKKPVSSRKQISMKKPIEIDPEMTIAANELLESETENIQQGPSELSGAQKMMKQDLSPRNLVFYAESDDARSSFDESLKHSLDFNDDSSSSDDEDNSSQKSHLDQVADLDTDIKKKLKLAFRKK